MSAFLKTMAAICLAALGAPSSQTADIRLQMNLIYRKGYSMHAKGKKRLTESCVLKALMASSAFFRVALSGKEDKLAE